MEPARHYEAAIRAMSEAAATAEATHAPIRLAYWRMAALDTLLARLEELRLAGEREMPEDTLELVVTFAQRHDHELRDRLQEINAEDVNVVHDAVFEAQGRVMLSLAELRRVPNWQDLDLVLEPGGEEAA
jgi:type VI protein secretion system component VasF